MLQKGKEWSICIPGGQNTNQYSYTTARKIQAKAQENFSIVKERLGYLTWRNLFLSGSLKPQLSPLRQSNAAVGADCLDKFFIFPLFYDVVIQSEDFHVLKPGQMLLPNKLTILVYCLSSKAWKSHPQHHDSSAGLCVGLIND